MAKYQLSYTGAQVLAMLESIAGKAEKTELSAETTARQAADTTLQQSLNNLQTTTSNALASKAPINSPTFQNAAYAPTPGASDWSTRLATTGFVRDCLNYLGISGGGAKFATGKYVGTGGGYYGTSYQNSLTFGFVPAVIWIEGISNINRGLLMPLDGMGVYLPWGYSNLQWLFPSVSGTTVYWYSTVGSLEQLNGGGMNYRYIAIG